MFSCLSIAGGAVLLITFLIIYCVRKKRSAQQQGGLFSDAAIRPFAHWLQTLLNKFRSSHRWCKIWTKHVHLCHKNQYDRNWAFLQLGALHNNSILLDRSIMCLHLEDLASQLLIYIHLLFIILVFLMTSKRQNIFLHASVIHVGDQSWYGPVVTDKSAAHWRHAQYM